MAETPPLKYILESLLFISSAPLGLDRIKTAVPEAETRDIRAAAEELMEEYEARGGGFTLKEVAGGYQLRTRPSFAPWIQKLHQDRPARLSRAALETLALIAYNQPVLRSYVEHVRGVDSGGVMKMLLDKGLIKVLGRDDKPGRPMLYATSKKFLEVFELKDLSELPSLKEIKEIMDQADARDALAAAHPDQPEDGKEEDTPDSPAPPLPLPEEDIDLSDLSMVTEDNDTQDLSEQDEYGAPEDRD